MQQQTILTCPAQLFRQRPETGELVDRGHCICALVGLPARPAKYSVVCYNSKQELLCTARLSDRNETSLQFCVHPDRPSYASFRDDMLDTWGVLFAKPEPLVRMLAELGAAFYVLNGAQTAQPQCTLHSPPDVSEDVLTVGVHEALAHYVAFALARSETHGETGHGGRTWLPTCERVVEATISPAEVLAASSSPGTLVAPPTSTTGELADRTEQTHTGPYRFRPVAPTHALPMACRGFESSLNGLSEGAYAVVVVPAASRVPPGKPEDAPPLTPLSAADVVLVVRLVQVRHRDVRATVSGGQGVDKSATRLPPAVFAETDVGDIVPATGLHASGSPTESLRALVPYTETTALVLRDRSDTTQASVGGPGIPLAHMTLIQKIGTGIQSAITTTRDVRDMASQAEEAWSYSVNRPKPSALSNAALVQQVSALVQAADARASEAARVDDVVRTLERQIAETQRRLDELSRRCDGLLKSRSSIESAAMDANLDRRRLLGRLREELAHVTEEREDTRRHLRSARTLHETLAEVCRVERGKLDIQRVQQQSLENRLTASHETIAVERERRHALEAKCATAQTELRRTQAELRLMADRLHTLHSKAESERDRYTALMEDERHRISSDALELRQNAITELQRLDEKHRTRYAELQQEHYQRGYAQGVARGREDSTKDLAVHRQELALELQRSSGALAERKDELQRGLEASLALRRTNESSLHDVKLALTEALERRARLEAQRARLATRTPTHDEDHLSGHLTTDPNTAAARTREEIATRLRGLLLNVQVPLPPSMLYHIVELAQRGEDALPGSTVAQINELEEAFVREALLRRAGWVEAELLSIYGKGEAVYYQEWLRVLQPAHTALRLAMQSIIGEQRGRHAAALYELWLMETDMRSAIEVERDEFISALVAQQSAHAAQRAQLLRKATTALTASFRGFERGLRAIRLLWESQIRAQTHLALEETEARLSLEREAEAAGRALPQMAADLQLGRLLAAQRVVLASEEAARAAIITAECVAASGLLFKFSEEREAVTQSRALRERGAACVSEEERERATIAREESSAWSVLEDTVREAWGLPTSQDVPVPPPPAASAAPPLAQAAPVVAAIAAAPLPPAPAAPTVATAALTAPTAPPVAVPASPPAPNPTTSAVSHAPVSQPSPPGKHTVMDNDDLFGQDWLAPPPMVAPQVPLPLLPDDDDNAPVPPPLTGTSPPPLPPTSAADVDAHTPARTPAATSVKASPVAGLAMAEQQWRTPHAQGVLDSFGTREPLAAPPPPPPSRPPSHAVSPPLSRDDSGPPKATHTATRPPLNEPDPPRPPAASASASGSYSDSSSTDSSASHTAASPPGRPAAAAGHRTTAPAPATAVSARTTRGPSKEASKEAIAAQAAAARAEKLRLFESSDDEL